jgi:hypothetical protein
LAFQIMHDPSRDCRSNFHDGGASLVTCASIIVVSAIPVRIERSSVFDSLLRGTVRVLTAFEAASGSPVLV